MRNAWTGLPNFMLTMAIFANFQPSWLLSQMAQLHLATMPTWLRPGIKSGLTLYWIMLIWNEGAKSFTDVTHHEIQDMTTARIEVTGGFRGTLNNTGKNIFLKRWRSTMMAYHALLFLNDEAKRAITTHIRTYEHYNPATGKNAYDGPTILSIIFQTMRANDWVNFFKEIGSMKDVTLASCDNNVVEWISKMEMKRINIKLKMKRLGIGAPSTTIVK